MRLSPSFYSEREKSMIQFLCDPRRTKGRKLAIRRGLRQGEDEGPLK